MITHWPTVNKFRKMKSLESVEEKQFDWSLDPKSLRDIFKMTDFDTKFAKMISKNVIKILSPQLIPDSHSMTCDEELLYEHLIGPLEKFVLNLDDDATNDDIKKTLDHIQSLNQPSKLCRRILKAGDVIFSCNDCGLDNTCVVCIDCFHKGAHKDHNYRMCNSDGGGCCDCGDIEAWKQNHACTDHMASSQPNMSMSEFEDRSLRLKQIQDDRKSILEKITRLPNRMASRYFLVCQASLHYAFTILNWEDFNNLPSLYEIDTDSDEDPMLAQLLSKASSSKNYFTVLFNDEVHTYDHVINILVRVIKCTKMTASIMASTISREGRSWVINDTFQTCTKYRNTMASSRDANNQDPLRVETIHSAVIAHQSFALRLIQWVRKMTSMCDAFRILTSFTLLGTHDSVQDSDETLVERIMLSNTKLWKIARVEWNDLFFTTLLIEYSIKEQLARLITRCYPELMRFFIEDDHDHSCSILTLTTQLYSVPSLTCMLVEEEDALMVLLKTFSEACRNAKRDNGSMSFENRHTFQMDSLRRAFYVIIDLRYLLGFQPTKWTSQLRKNVINAAKLFLDLLEMMQGMDSTKRQVGQHLEYEPDWESGMSLQNKLITLISRFVDYCSLDEEVLLSVVLETQLRLVKDNGYKRVAKEMLGYTANCINYDVTSLPISIHLPLTRFAAALILVLMQRRPCETIPYDESLVILARSSKSPSKPLLSMIDLMEPSLRAEIMIAQFRSGMWRRNGYSLVNQLHHFHSSMMRREMFDRDILLLQECAAMHDPNEFMMHLINKFQLFTWIVSESTRENAGPPKANTLHTEDEVMAQTISLGEELLQLILTIVGERYRVGVGQVKEEDVIKHEIIQLLCVGPLTRSEITQKLSVMDNELDCIKAVAFLKRSSSTATGKYELREEFYDRFNPFFYHYSRRLQSNALDAQLKRKKNLGHSLVCCPPPAPVAFTGQFSNINEILKCGITLIIIQKVLKRTLNPPEERENEQDASKYKFRASELQLDQCLHLIGLGLYEQERNPTGFRYLICANHKDIFSLLKEAHAKSKHSKDLIFWLMRTTDALVDKILEQAGQNLLVDDELVEVCTSIKSLFRSAFSTEDTTNQDTKKRNSQLAAQRRERIMALMKANQDRFLSNPTTKQLVAETERHEGPGISQPTSFVTSATPPVCGTTIFRRLPRKTIKSSLLTKLMVHKGGKTDKAEKETQTCGDDRECAMSVDSPEQQGSFSAQMDVDSSESDQEQPYDPEEKLIVQPECSHLCILCRDEQMIGFDRPTMVLLAYIQRSAVLSKNRAERRIPNYQLTPSNHVKHQFGAKSSSGSGPMMYSFTSDNSWSFDATFMPSDLFFSPHISTCGHVMHYECWRGYSEAVLKRETSRMNRSARHVSFEPEKHEILCPLCECISNATIPLLPNYTCFATRRKQSEVQVDTVFSTPRDAIEKSSERLSACLNALRGTVDMFKHIRHIKEVSTNIAVNHEDKHIRLLQPRNINDVLEELDELGALGLRDFISSIRSQKISSNACNKTLLSSMSALSERIHLVGLDLARYVLDTHLSRIFLMTSWTVSYTIQSHERVSRSKGSPIFEDLEFSSKNIGLSSLLRFAFGSMMTHQSDMMQSLLVRKLRYLLINDEHLSSSPCCLDIDAFEMLVSLLILLQKLYSHIEDVSHVQQARTSGSQADPSILSSSPLSTASSTSSRTSESHYAWITQALDHEYFRNLIHWMLILNLIQVCISLQTQITIEDRKQERIPSEHGEAQQSQECIVFKNFYNEILLASGHPNDKSPTVNEKFCTKIRSRLLPFLRYCALFMFHLSHIPPPDLLRSSSAFKESPKHNGDGSSIRMNEVNGSIYGLEDVERDGQSFDEQVNWDGVDDEFNSLCLYLNLPDKFSILLQSQEARHLARSWLRHSRIIPLIKSAIDAAMLKEGSQLTKLPPTSRPSGSTQTPSSLQSNLSTTNLQTPKTELMPVKYIHQPHPVNRLIDLPHDYSELVDRVSDFTCPSIKNEDSRTPTLCLVCGVILCSQSYCCQRDLNELASNYQQILQSQQTEASRRLLGNPGGGSSSGRGSVADGSPGGSRDIDNLLSTPVNSWPTLSFNPSMLVPAGGSNSNPPGVHSSSSVINQQLVGSCTYHAYECSGGVGVFLRIRNCQILLLSGRTKGCYMAAPYIDDHGETDFGLHRGNPLHLNQDHYRKVELMWLTHTIPEQISRTLEYSPYFSNINWHLH